MKKLINLLFGIYKKDGHVVIKFLGIKAAFKWFNINRLEDICSIQNLKELEKLNTHFPHPIGIVIHHDAHLGRNCIIYQNVTIGQGKYIEHNHSDVPIIGDNVTIYANSVLVNGIKIGNNVTIGAGSIVLNDVPDNTTVAGNPARVLNVKVCVDNNR